MKALSGMLKVNTTLTNLYLHSEKNTKNMMNVGESFSRSLFVQTENQFGLDGAKALSDALKQHPIQKLWLGCERNQAYASEKGFTKQSPNRQ